MQLVNYPGEKNMVGFKYWRNAGADWHRLDTPQGVFFAPTKGEVFRKAKRAARQAEIAATAARMAEIAAKEQAIALAETDARYGFSE